MNRYLSFQILFFLSVIIILISGRALYYDELNDDSNTKLSAIKDAGNAIQKSIKALFLTKFLFLIRSKKPSIRTIKSIR